MNLGKWFRQPKNAMGDTGEIEECLVWRMFFVWTGYSILPCGDWRQIQTAPLLPPAICRLFLHKDPFDRMLLAQTKCEGMSLLTSDGILREYAGSVVFISKA